MADKLKAYRGVRYTLAYGPSLTHPRKYPVWHGIVAFDSGTEVVGEATLQKDILATVKRTIDARLGRRSPGTEAKLRRMTVQNGCTPPEAATARALLSNRGCQD